MTEVIRVQLGFVNSYILREGESCILVDTGTPGGGPKLQAALAAQGIGWQQIKLVVLSHAHGDHLGAAAWLQQEQQLPIAMHIEDTAGLASLRHRGPQGLFLRVVSGHPEREQLDFRPDHLLADGQSLTPWGVEARVVHLPGHTRGSIGLLLPDGGLLAGDMFMNFTRPSLAHIFEDAATLAETLSLLQRQYRIGRVYPGHGKDFAFADYFAE